MDAEGEMKRFPGRKVLAQGIHEGEGRVAEEGKMVLKEPRVY